MILRIGLTCRSRPTFAPEQAASHLVSPRESSAVAVISLTCVPVSPCCLHTQLPNRILFHCVCSKSMSLRLSELLSTAHHSGSLASAIGHPPTCPSKVSSLHRLLHGPRHSRRGVHFCVHERLEFIPIDDTIVIRVGRAMKEATWARLIQAGPNGSFNLPALVL